MRAALYVRVSTLDQNLDNQLDDLRKYVAQRGWGAPVEYADRASGAKDSRPALDALLKAARRREFDVVVVWRLDRLGRSLKHLLDVLHELTALGVAFVSLNEGIDATTPVRAAAAAPARRVRGVRAGADSRARARAHKCWFLAWSSL